MKIKVDEVCRWVMYPHRRTRAMQNPERSERVPATHQSHFTHKEQGEPGQPPPTAKMNQGEIILYQTDDGRSRVECRFVDRSIWLTQRLLAELFQTSVPNISQHLTAIFAEGELSPYRTVKKYLIVQLEGTRQISREVDHYNLEAILAVGYRVRSPRGTAFRQWATARLSEYLVKGFAMDDERLKNPGRGVTDNFDEMLARIRDIRSAERRMYLQVRNLLALAADYAPNDEETSDRTICLLAPDCVLQLGRAALRATLKRTLDIPPGANSPWLARF